VSKEEVVRLVSRAIAVVQFITAMLEITYLPERLMSLHHYQRSGGWLAAAPDYLATLYSTEVGMLFFRIAGLLILSWIFWQCGARIIRLLLPDSIGEGQTG
jgi:hypothetical protein